MAEINIALDGLCIIVTFLVLMSLTSQSFLKENKYFLGMTVTLLVILITDQIDWYFDGNASYRMLLYFSVSVNYISNYVIVNYFTRYISVFVISQRKTLKNIVNVFDILCVASFFLTLINIPFPCLFSISANGFYQRGPYYMLSQIYPFISLSVLLVFILKAKGLDRRTRFIFMLYPLIPIIGIIIDYSNRELSLTCVVAFLSVMCIYIYIYTERGKQIAEKETEMMEQRIAIMMSQIKPHFLYNALSSIQSLCHDDPVSAEKAIGEFSEFLRGNMESLSTNKPIEFEQELEHVQHYLNIERMRFPDKLHVEYDIQTVKFRIPTLTLQPLVENAVRYGITKKIEGGTVKISAKETEDAYIVTVEDNGAGFDPEEIQDDGRTHIGIQNVRNRLAVRCGGDLTVISRPSIGTSATITLPKKGKL